MSRQGFQKVSYLQVGGPRRGLRHDPTLSSKPQTLQPGFRGLGCLGLRGSKGLGLIRGLGFSGLGFAGFERLRA